MGYMEVCLKVKNAGWIEVDDPEGPYAYSKDKTIWVGYDTPGSAADKVGSLKCFCFSLQSFYFILNFCYFKNRIQMRLCYGATQASFFFVGEQKNWAE